MNMINRMIFNIAQPFRFRYKPCGPHTFCWRKTADLEFRVCCRSEAEASVPGAAGEGRKPVRAMLTNASLLAVSLDGLDHELRRMVLIMSVVEWLRPDGLATRFGS